MATASADPLRSTLDNLEIDPRSEADRPYLVAMLRRLGYTERDIEQVIRTGKMPTAAPVDEGLAPQRDYRVVVPARDTRFALDNTGQAAATDAPFEDLERLEFQDETPEVEFEAVTEFEPVAEEEEPVAAEPTWIEEDAPAETVPVEELPLEEAQEPAEESEAERALREQAERDAALAATPIHTFGDPDAQVATPKTRVRVRRVRAASKEEAERKVAGSGRHVIKSVPVDIVERWGANARGADEDPDSKKKGA